MGRLVTCGIQLGCSRLVRRHRLTGINGLWTGKPSVAFFQLYPLLIHIGIFAGLPGIPDKLILSNVAFAGAGYYFTGQ